MRATVPRGDRHAQPFPRTRVRFLRSVGRADVVVKKGMPNVVVVGLPGEIVLHAYGRNIDKARLVVQGERGDVEAFEAAPRGF